MADRPAVLTRLEPPSPASPDSLAARLLDETTELVCAATPHGRITYVNRAWRRALGYSAEEAAGLRPVDLVAAEHRGHYVEAARRLVRGEAVEDFEAVLLAKDGRRVVCRGRATAEMGEAPNGEGRVCVGTLTVYRDVTAEREAEAVRARLVATCEATPDFMGIALAGGRIDYLNRGGRRLLGLADDADLSSYGAERFHPPETLALLAEVALPAAARHGAWRGEGELLAADGERVPVSMVIVAQPALGADGAPPFFSAVMRDLRERRRVEAALGESQARLRAALDGGKYAFVALRPARDGASPGAAVVDFDVVQLNAQAAAFLGLPPGAAESLVGRRYCELLPRARVGGHFERYVRVLETGEPSEYEFEAADPRFRPRWVRVQAVPLPDGVALLARDVTAEKRAERERTLLVDVTRALSAAADLRSAAATALEAMCAATGWEYGEAWLVTPPAAGDGAAPALTHGPVWHAPNDERLARFAAASDGFAFARGVGLPGACWAAAAPTVVPALGAPEVDFRRLAHADDAGLRAGVAVPVVAPSEAGGDVVAVLTFHTRDAAVVDAARVELVTAVAAQAGEVVRRKLAEDALARERSFLAAVLDSLSEGIVACDAAGRLTLLNRATRELHGLPAEGDVPPERWGDHYSVYRADGVTPMPFGELPLVRALAAGGDVCDAEFVIAPNGAPRRTLVANARAIRGPAGGFLGAVCAARDMTAERAAAAALRESEERHRALLATLPLVVYMVQPEPPYAPFYVSPGVAALGYTHDEWMASPDAWVNALHPDDRERVLAESAAAFAERRALDYEYRLLAKDGSVRWVHDRGEFVLGTGGGGGPDVWRGIMFDVTARREAQAALREREARFSLIYNSASDLMYLLRVDRDGGDGAPATYRCESVNDAYLSVTGLTRDDLLGRSLEEMLEPEAAEAARDRYDLAALTGDVLRYDEEVDLAAGRVVMETTLTPVLDDAGRCTHLLGAARDVSARRRAEAALRASEAQFRGTLETVRSVAVTLGLDGRVTFANEALLALTGWSHDEAVGADWFARFVPSGHAVRDLFFDMVARGEVVPHYENEIVTRGGARRLIAWDNVVVRDGAGAVVGTASIGQDVTEQRRAEAALRESEARVRGAVEASLDALYVYRAVREPPDPLGPSDALGSLGALGAIADFEVVDCNARAAAMVAMPREDLLGQRLAELFPVVRTTGAVARYAGVVATGEPIEYEMQSLDPRVAAGWYKVQVVKVGDGVAVTARDITDHKETEETLRSLALVDELTGLQNRRGFTALAEREWQRARREGRGAVLAYIDLDGFKPINDTYGHAEGDRALRAVADVLRSVFRGADVVGRFGGDEFAAFVVPGGSAQGAADVAAIERRIRDRLAQQLEAANAAARAAGRPYDLAMSVGTARVAPNDDGAPRSLAALMVEADERLYDEKRRGGRR